MNEVSGALNLPVEIIYQILLFLSPHELVPLQTVSKQFFAIINDGTFWRTVYAHAHFPRPPGPFPWQSTNFLQRTLVHSSRLAQRWTSQPINVVSMYSRVLKSNEDCKWVCGRWLIVCMEMTQLVSRDVDTGSEQTLYQSDDQWILSWGATCCTTSAQGHLLYVGLYTRNGVKLLELRADDASGHLYAVTTLDVPINYSDGNVSLRVDSSHTPFVFISADVWQKLADALIFDTRSRTFYKFPPEHRTGPQDETRLERWLRLRYDEFVLTMTHIIVFRLGSSFVVQAYIIPSDDEIRELRLSHEATIRGCFKSWSLLRDSIIDPISGSTRMRLLHVSQSFCRPAWQLVCTDLTLPANVPGSISPMSMDSHIMFSVDNVQCEVGSKLVQATPDGLVRGLCVLDADVVGWRCVRKFDIDATAGERCVGVVGDPAPLWPGAGLDLRRISLNAFDGRRGRLCYTKNIVGGETVAIAVDLE